MSADLQNMIRTRSYSAMIISQLARQVPTEVREAQNSREKASYAPYTECEGMIRYLLLALAAELG